MESHDPEKAQGSVTPAEVGGESDRTDRASSVATSLEQTVNQNKDENIRRFSVSGAGQLSLEDVASVQVRIRDLEVSVNTAPSWWAPSTYTHLVKSKFNTEPDMKTLLHSVNADLAAGSLTAIIGGSGSGKTTLLNTMAERMVSSRLHQEGIVTFNGEISVHNVRHAYVMQQDILLPTLTVRETLRYAADLRLPSTAKRQDRWRIVEEVIRELGLKECADTRIGNSQHRGCSGGEKRRVSIGVQLLANPSVLFLDEPTTGLDATSAYQLVRTLKALAKKGRTIITTIHQPRSEIWNLFDNIVILTRGSPVYSGDATECIPWFESQGFPIPAFVNPAEFVIDIAAIDNRTPELETESSVRVETLKRSWGQASEKQFLPVGGILSQPNRHHRRICSHGHDERAGFWRQLRVLTSRTFKVTYRDPMGMTAAILEAVLLGAITGYMFWNVGRDQAGIRSRQGGLYITAGLQGYLILLFEVYRLTIDMPTFDRENSENCVDPLPFILSRRLARMPTEDIPVPFIFSVLMYFMSGFDRDVGKFFTFFAITLLNQYVSVTCAMACVTAVRHFPGASLMANLVYTIQSIACGMFVQSSSIPVYVRWIKWTAYNFYAFSAYCANEFQGSFYDCPFPGGRDNPACQQYTGQYIMKSLGFPTNWIARPIVALASFIALFLLLSTVGLTFLKVEMTIARARTTDTDLSAGKEKMTARSIGEVRAIDVGLDKFALALDKKAATGKRLPRRLIVNPVTATFQAGTLNVIMGPSGSGKTSLLNAMALRLRNSVGNKYRPSGKLTFNSAVPSDSVIRSVCSYVCQDDDALLPSLTVRETLRFAAGLRLPSFMSTEEKYRRAEEVLLKMGLKDCANNLVGNDMIKGISGGEKRRASIAVQVLTDPRVLLLDEPTSGLDAFTASSIMEVLQGLANEGRTLILTIHQARSDLFKHFGNVLLLSRGGHPVYAGASRDMLGYFGKHGYDCPKNTNPADFALDMITVDLQKEDIEAESRERVKRLVKSWEEHQDPTGNTHEPRLSPIHEETDEPNEKRKSLTTGFQINVSDEGEPSEKSQTTSSGDKGALEPRGAFTAIPRRSFNRANLSTPAELGALVRKRTSIVKALPLLLRRAVINTRRQPELILARTMQVAGLAGVFTLFFAPFKHDYFSVQNRMGYVQQLGAFYFVGMLQNVAVYPAERDVFYREDDDGVYGVDAFLLSYTVLELPFEVLSCLVYGLFSTFAVRNPETASLYFAAFFGCFGVVSCGESLGIMFNTLFAHTGFAVNIMGVFLSVANGMAGVLSINMPGAFNALNYLSPIRYATRAMAPYALRGVDFHCTAEQALPDGSCPVTSGEQVLELYNFDVDPNVNAYCLLACVVIYRLIAWVLLRVTRARWKDRKRVEV
ncbi:ABC efflux transporter [Cordyceps fumosorosea ARSEF 2679]|uniref:ABC efflux transporter n=1 Tax=Cordyceps fumosorosea (strain ARSEF 2679) TaxID=1081104 RepID=A0A167QLL3_CORFA|nr:ABC efflux transporter [Cordyceps fumosorosea ARSEF 2679]OAA57750.1 ABC efflux transporter [Cordyceps fumosorosea ARSEF 2679]